MTARLTIALGVLLVLAVATPSLAIPGLSEARQAASAVADAAAEEATEEQTAPSDSQVSGAKATHAVLPFPVYVDGEPARVTEQNASYAVIKDAVTPYVEVRAKAEADMLIINVFPCDSDGNVPTGATPAIILGQGTTTVKLSDTMDKQPLTPGNYIMNIVIAELGTARVKFEVE
jgi:hypothetical protein